MIRRLSLSPWYYSFQWKLYHRLIPTGRYLHLRRLRNDASCSICDESSDTLEHFFFYCIPVRALWADLESSLVRCDANISLSREVCVLRAVNGGIPLNTILVWTRAYIYRSKLSDSISTYARLRAVLQTQYDLLCTLATRAGRMDTFLPAWSTFSSFFT